MISLYYITSVSRSLNLFFKVLRAHLSRSSTCHYLGFIAGVLLVILPSALIAQETAIIPKPQSYILGQGQFQLSGITVIGMNDDSLLPLANYLQTELQRSHGLAIAVDSDEIKALIDLRLMKGKDSEDIAGAYKLTIAPQKVTISAAGEQGVFYGIISLLQMLAVQPNVSPINLQAGEIIDTPHYQWRGFMLDESRHFFGKAKVKQLLDWMAFYKLNKFHWHLTDVNGWRIEIKKYPKLATVGGVGNYSDTLAEARYYGQADIREIVAYAKDRYIDVIPEIDMPGHATAANKAYPEFSGGSVAKYPNFTFDPANEKTYQYLADVLRETDMLFPAKMIHLGGDEVALGIQAWAGRPAIMEQLAKNHFGSLADLEHFFFKRMADTVIGLNSKVLCWDEAAETDLPADKTIIFWWRQNIPSQLRLALKKKFQVVLCPRLPFYFDFVQDKDHRSGRKWNGTVNSVSSVYNFPYTGFPADQSQPGQVLGIQANLWTEMVGSEKRLDFLVFPRMAALAEAAWTYPAAKDENSFNQRLRAEFPLYDRSGIYYYDPFDPSYHPEVIDFAPRVIKAPVRSKHHARGHQLKLHGRRGKKSNSKAAGKAHHKKVKRAAQSNLNFHGLNGAFIYFYRQ